MSNRGPRSPLAVISGSLAQRPGYGGHTWVLLQYLLGFKRLGWEVLFLDRLEPEMCVDTSGNPTTLNQSVNLAYFLDIMRRFGLHDSFSLSYNSGEQVLGLSKPDVMKRARSAAFMLNVMGYLDDPEILEAVPLRVFLDIDPGFGQMWRDLGYYDLFAGHDVLVTVGQNIGRPNCVIPTCDLEWITTPQPVVLDYWPARDCTVSAPITSVASWRGPFGPIEYRGDTYGLRVHEFRKLVELPRLTDEAFQLALDIHPSEVDDIDLLTRHGWLLLDPKEVACDPWAYQTFIQRSRAELMTAKNMYVATRSGWFSDRSICYLASGKPVIAQDTGLSQLYPTDHGLLLFSTLDEAVWCVQSLERDYERHARAAREIAEEYFDSDKVLGRLLGQLSIA